MLKKYSILLVIAVAFVCLFGSFSCNLINPPPVIPCYGHIDTMDITTNYPTEGSASSAISCAWVYVDDEPVGAFSLPCKFPIIAGTGSHLITIFPGITADGINSTREKYPFYTSYNTNVNIKQDSVVTFKYVPTYTSITLFDWLEDFEARGVSIATYLPGTTDSNTKMTPVGPPDAYQGQYSGEVILDTTLYTGISIDTFNLPNDGSPVFLEMNYNTNNVFGVGLFYDATQGDGYQEANSVELNPTTGWKKIYIDLGPFVANHPGPYKVYFVMQRQPGISSAKLLLDNIKVVHLKGA
jgi:hypothetical protein